MDDIIRQLQGSNAQNSTTTEAKEIWKMLDDLSEKDPEAYKQFVATNLQKGKEHIESEAKKYNIEYTPRLADFNSAFKIRATIANDVTEATPNPLLIQRDDKLQPKPLAQEATFYISLFSHDKVEECGRTFDKLLHAYSGSLVPAPSNSDRLDFYISDIEGKHDYGTQKYYVSMLMNSSTLSYINSKGDLAIRLLYSVLLSEMNYLVNNVTRLFADQLKLYGVVKVDFEHQSLKRISKYKSKYGDDIFSVKYEFKNAHKNLGQGPKPDKPAMRPDVLLEDPKGISPGSPFKDGDKQTPAVKTKKPVISVISEEYQDESAIEEVDTELQR